MNIRIKNYSTRINAEVEKMLLEVNGVHCIVMSDDAGGMEPWVGLATGGVWLMVKEEDAEEALEILKDNS